MEKKVYLLLMFCIVSLMATAQDEGAVIKKERLERTKSFYISAGPSFTLGKNIGDYSKGASFEFGFLKRINRVLSVGPSLSYTSFKYDPKVTTAQGGGAYVSNGDPNDWATTYSIPDLAYDYGYVLNLSGGNLKLLSLGYTIKLNLIPVKDNTKVSIYGFAKPFLTVASRGDVSGSADRYAYETYVDDSGDLNYNLGDATWYKDGYSETWGPHSGNTGNTGYPALRAETKVTGGIFLGPGIEFMPVKPLSVFAQAAFGYTFPITYVSTKSYDNTVASYASDKFPMIKKGFPLINIQVGLSYNF
jgi:hypothetical protein